tara:strand:- start:721 stop:1308 length:588 start_codon:yes stop_codon:yes gene_type:complete
VDLKKFNNNTTDADFDGIFKNHISSLSNLHWTPLKVARKAAEWLSIDDNSKILDIGSGIGKFCFIGALTTKAEYTGVEQRKNLVKISNKVIKQNKISNTKFVNDNFINIDFDNYTGFYLYNPFWENISNDQLIDNKIATSIDLYEEYNKILSLKLTALKPGTLVVTYLMKEENIPISFSIFRHDFERNLILWKKN